MRPLLNSWWSGRSGRAHRTGHRPSGQYPTITAQRIFEELRDAGYSGGYTAIKVRVRKLQPKAAPKPSLPTPVTGPGEMAESDWTPYTVDLEGGGRITASIRTGAHPASLGPRHGPCADASPSRLRRAGQAARSALLR